MDLSIKHTSKWPSRSTDLNSMNMFWSESKRTDYMNEPKSIKELVIFCMDKGQKFSRCYIERLCTVILSGTDFTKYSLGCFAEKKLPEKVCHY